jgi:hypothetical protein
MGFPLKECISFVVAPQAVLSRMAQALLLRFSFTLLRPRRQASFAA